MCNGDECKEVLYDEYGSFEHLLFLFFCVTVKVFLCKYFNQLVYCVSILNVSLFWCGEETVLASKTLEFVMFVIPMLSSILVVLDR